MVLKISKKPYLTYYHQTLAEVIRHMPSFLTDPEELMRLSSEVPPGTYAKLDMIPVISEKSNLEFLPSNLIYTKGASISECPAFTHLQEGCMFFGSFSVSDCKNFYEIPHSTMFGDAIDIAQPVMIRNSVHQTPRALKAVYPVVCNLHGKPGEEEIEFFFIIAANSTNSAEWRELERDFGIQRRGIDLFTWLDFVYKLPLRTILTRPKLSSTPSVALLNKLAKRYAVAAERDLPYIESCLAKEPQHDEFTDVTTYNAEVFKTLQVVLLQQSLFALEAADKLSPKHSGVQKVPSSKRF
jgi:hypothetical protein